VKAAHVLEQSPTGYVAKLREPSVLVDQGEDHWVIEPASR